MTADFGSSPSRVVPALGGNARKMKVVQSTYPYEQIILLGDSLIESAVEVRDGYAFHSKLQTYCNRFLDVVNRGFGGYNTDFTLRYLHDIIPPRTESSPRIAYLFILLGTNDACIPLPGTFQHVPIDDYKQNLRSIIEHPNVRAHDPQICLITPPPINEIQYQLLDQEWGYSEQSRRTEVTGRYAEKMRELSREIDGLVLIDLWKAIMDHAEAKSPGDFIPGGPLLGTLKNGNDGGLRSLFWDSLHLSGEGFEILHDLIIPHIQLPERRFPMWMDLNPRLNQDV